MILPEKAHLKKSITSGDFRYELMNHAFDPVSFRAFLSNVFIFCGVFRVRNKIIALIQMICHSINAVDTLNTLQAATLNISIWWCVRMSVLLLLHIEYISSGRLIYH